MTLFWVLSKANVIPAELMSHQTASNHQFMMEKAKEISELKNGQSLFSMP